MHNKDESAQGGLKIHVKKKFFEFKIVNILGLIFVIIISIVCGALAAGYITSEYVSEIKDTVIISQEDKQISDGINKVLTSIVTISCDENAIKQEYDENNISGIIIDENGYIITNYSKIKDKDKIFVKVTAVGMEPIEGFLIGKDESMDMALIKIDMQGLCAIKFGNVKDVRVGEQTFTVGNVYSSSEAGLATVGRITSKSERINNKGKLLLQTDAIVNRENTGGALCDINGNLLGMVSDKISKDKNKESLYYAISADEIKEFNDEIIKGLNTIGIEEKTVIIGEGSWSKGVYINSIDSDSMAQEAGLQPMDIIVEMDGKKINYIEDIFLVIKNKDVGESVKCVILRKGKEQQIDLKITKDTN